MKRILSVIILLAMPLILPAQKCNLMFDKNGVFKIVQLTDLHFMAGKTADNDKTFARMDFIVKEEKPDFIAITGDVIYGRKPSKELLQSVLDRLDSYRIPFCLVFGNHDAEQDMSRQEMSAMVASAKYSMNELNAAGELDDMKLVVSPTVDRKSSPLNLYFLDSHDYAKVGGFAWLTHDQIQWYRRECEASTNRNGGMNVPSMAFFHIPLPEFLEAWLLAEAQKHNSVVGLRGEYGGHPRVNSGMFSAMLETGNTMGVFCGHDHDSDFIVPHYGIALVYGRFSGDDNTYNHLAHGTRVISVKEGEMAFNTWIHEDDGRIQYNVRFENGAVSKIK